MSDPSEGDISSIIEITGYHPVDDRQLVIQALKSNSGSVENAINDFLNDADGFRTKYSTKWDESLFAGDRDGKQDELARSTHIEGPASNQSPVIYGVEPSPYADVGAPSRPPSRTKDRSPLESITDWTVSNAGVPGSYAQEEEDVRRAIRESAQEAGYSIPAQETGVVSSSTSEPHFGPANRDDYDSAQWSMVPTSAVTAIPSSQTPPPSSRKRPEGIPALLTGQPASWYGQHRLGGFLTILHGIPLARNLLLQGGSPPSSYGHNSQWWNGQEILAPHVLSQTGSDDIDTGGAVDGSFQDTPQVSGFEHEIHRLMAFLDLTERSYGSASVLATNVGSAASDMERRFYEIFGARNTAQVAPFYTVVVITNLQGASDEDSMQDFGLIDLQNLRADYDKVKTLYELIDCIMWSDMLNSDSPDETTRMAMFREMGDILSISMGGDGPTDRIEIPEELYPERWLESRRRDALKIQKALQKDRKEAATAKDAKMKLFKFLDPETAREHDKRDVAVRTKKGFGAYCDYLEARGRFRTVQESGFDADKYPDYRSAPSTMTEAESELHRTLTEAVKFAQNSLDEGNRKMEELDQRLERIEAHIKFLGRLLTNPNKPGRPEPMRCKKYLLQGITSSSEVTYICRRPKAHLIELDDAPETRDQWWRLSFTAQDKEQPVHAETLNFEEVMQKVWKETKTPLLVYASEKAIYAEPAPLSSSLETFVKADNKAFRQELVQESLEPSRVASGSSEDAVRSPPKRKHRSDSIDSMATNRASAGSQDGDAERESAEDPFVDSCDSKGTSKAAPGRRSEAATVASAEVEVTTARPAPPSHGPPPLPKRLESKEPEMQERVQIPMLNRFLSGDKDAHGAGASKDMDLGDED
ncbi:ubiquitin interaction motif protein [Geosmithia morbida]|uniref:Ubiquitin interaction motif protein n=1 Tax=Geosmithia morbida TaxID=1094350 RepID=A0A9P5D3T5_9HYPO|nr:ubiquitin interaction motif protein [Geosmithia morbida]KAF4120829.1 ubiquitin interaction motif protein [Geosmithia morbida]